MLGFLDRLGLVRVEREMVGIYLGPVVHCGCWFIASSGGWSRKG